MLNTEVEVASHFPPHYLLMVHLLTTFIRLVRFSWVDIKSRVGALFRVHSFALEIDSSRFPPVIIVLDLFAEADGNKNVTVTIGGDVLRLRSSERSLVDDRRRGDVEPGPCPNRHGSFDSACEAGKCKQRENLT